MDLFLSETMGVRLERSLFIKGLMFVNVNADAEYEGYLGKTGGPC